MTLIFKNHSFKYEIEAVCKLFFPVRPFYFLMISDADTFTEPEGDYSFLALSESEKEAEAYVKTRINSRISEKSSKLSKDSREYRHDCEYALCRLLFLTLCELTGLAPEWGMLTGVRPVKLVASMEKSGLSAEEIKGRLAERYFVSESKSALALKTLSVQHSAGPLPKNSVSLYVSIPFCPSRCAYCSFVSQTVGSFLRLIPEYTERLCDEILYTSRIVNNLGLKLDTVYFGGGTPTALEAKDLEKIMRKISACFDISALREYTVEAGRPDTVTAEKLNVIKNNGGNRVSVNPQTLHQNVLDAIGRRHTVEQFFEAYGLAKSAGFDAVNVDLIAGLPGDSLEGFADSLNGVIGLKPENITVHALSIKRSADLMHSENTSADGGEVSKMISNSCNRLIESGYEPYYLYRQKNQLGNQENVGWERGGSLGIYNINMMEEVQTVLAVGAGGSTKIVADERNIRRLYNPKYPLEYLRRYDTTVAVRKREAERLLREIRGRENE